MAATFADTLLSPAGSAISGALVRVTPLESSSVDVRVISGFTDGNGQFSLSIPSGIACLFFVPSAGLDHVLTPVAGDTVTLADVLAGDGSGDREATWL